MSVLDRSAFSYQVAAGSTTSDSSVVDVIRKSIDISMSSFPSGLGSLRWLRSPPYHDCGRRSAGVGAARRFESVPSRWRRKYSLPLLDEPSRLARQTLSTRGQLRGSSGSVTASATGPRRVPPRRRRAPPSRPPRPRRRGPGSCGRTAGRTATSPSRRPRRARPSCACPEPPAPQRARERVGSVPVVPPLVGVRVPVRRARHLPRRARPVGRHRHRRPSGDRATFLLPDVVRPPAAVAAHRPGEQQQREHRAVGGVAVEPLADPGTHDDHGPAVRIDRVRRELARHPDRLRRRHSRDRLLPRRRVGGVGVVVAARPLAGQAGPATPYWASTRSNTEHTAARRPRAPARPGVSAVPRAVDRVERRQGDLLRRPAATRHRQRRNDATQVQIPPADPRLAVAEPERTRPAPRPARSPRRAPPA